MLSVFISYLYIGITTFLLGFGVRMFVKKYLGYEIHSVISLIYAGLGFAVVYAGIYSLFSGVSLGANLGMLLMCSVIIWMGKQELFSYIKQQKYQLSKGKSVFLVILLLVFAYGGSRGYFHFLGYTMHRQFAGLKNMEWYRDLPICIVVWHITAVPLF